MLQVEVKGRVNLDKLTAFLEELRVSRSRTVSLGTLMCASHASAADNTHIVEVRCCYHYHQPARCNADRCCALAVPHALLLAGNHWIVLTLALAEAPINCIPHPSAYCMLFVWRLGACSSLQEQPFVCSHEWSQCICSQLELQGSYVWRMFCQSAVEHLRMFWGNRSAGKPVRGEANIGGCKDGEFGVSHAH